MKIKISEFFSITNEILNESKKHFVIHAISYLNNIKIDEFSYNKLEILKNKNFYLKCINFFLLNFVKFLLRSFTYFFLNNKRIIIKKKIIFINRFVNNSNNEIYFKNFYKLNSIKQNSVNLYLQTFKQQILSKNSNAIPFKNLSIIDEIIIIKYLINGFFYLCKEYFKTNKNLKKKVLLVSISSIFSGDTHLTLRICQSVKKISLENKIQKVVTLYEGNGYERLLFLYLKDIPNCETIGYQHTGISKYQNNLLKLKNTDFFPNHILVVNQFDKEKLKKINKFSNICNVGKKQFKIFNKIKKWKINNYKFLVFFTTSFMENNKIIDLISNSNLHDFKFILRFHPALISNSNYSEKVKKYLLKKGVNCFISKNKSLSTDLSHCGLALIGSGSSLIDCIDSRVFPIIFKNRNIIDTPANYESKNFKFIKNKYQMDDFIKKINSNLLKYNYESALNFSNKYFNKFTCECLNKIL